MIDLLLLFHLKISGEFFYYKLCHNNKRKFIIKELILFKLSEIKIKESWFEFMCSALNEFRHKFLCWRLRMRDKIEPTILLTFNLNINGIALKVYKYKKLLIYIYSSKSWIIKILCTNCNHGRNCITINSCKVSFSRIDKSEVIREFGSKM